MKYHAFLCYNSKNISDVKIIYEYLNNANFSLFFDKISLCPGDIHTEKIDRALKSCDSILVFIGEHGVGPWQKEEIFCGHWSSVQSSGVKIIPIYLPNACIDHPEIPTFLKSRSDIRFNNEIEDKDKIQEIAKGILNSARTSGVSSLEKPLTNDEHQGLINTTIKAYENPEMAERFYDTWGKDMPLHKIELFQKQLQKKAVVLDAGCGPGHHSHYLHSQGLEVTGIDLSSEALRIAVKGETRAPFHLMDMRKTEFKRNTFDGIWASASCVHISNDFMDQQLREFYRILKPGGIIGITLLAGRLPAIEKDGRFFEGYRDVDDILRYIKHPGFKVLDVSTDTTKKMTHGIKKVSEWVAVVAAVPEKKPLIML